MAQPLPSLTEAISCRLLPPDYANAHSTYRLILTAEKETGDNKRLIHIRTLGYLLLRPMSDVALTHVVDEIISCNRDKNFVLKLDELGGLYLDTLLTLCECYLVPPRIAIHPSLHSQESQRQIPHSFRASFQAVRRPARAVQDASRRQPKRLFECQETGLDPIPHLPFRCQLTTCDCRPF